MLNCFMVIKIPIFTTISCFLLLLVSCMQYRSVRPTVSQEQLPETCEHLIEIVEEKWRSNKKYPYYEGKEDFLTVLQRDYRECIFSLGKERLVQIFGTPSEDQGLYIFYFLAEGCIGTFPQDCQILLFQFYRDNPEKLIYYQVQPYGFVQ